MDICEAREISFIQTLVLFLLFFENLTKGDGVKIRGKWLLQFKMIRVKL
jgi:hypothetical protein